MSKIEEMKIEIDNLKNRIQIHIDLLRHPTLTPVMDERKMANFLEECLQAITQREAVSIDEMVNRFLCWKLPEDFAPDYGISFVRNEMHDRHGMPTGTNLLHAGQAKAMFEHCALQKQLR